MAYESVVVHSVDLLENFRDVLQQQHDELEVVYLRRLYTQEGCFTDVSTFEEEDNEDE